jgi:putative hydrolase of the HAD superfamily
MYALIAESISKSVYGLKKQRILRVIREVHEDVKRMKAFNLVKNEEIIDKALKRLTSRLNIEQSTVEDAIIMSASKASSEIVIPGAYNVLKLIRSRGLRTVLLGNVLFWSSSVTRQILKKVGLLNLIDAAYFADEVGIHKPDPRIFHMPLLEFHVQPEEAMHIGDSITEDFGGALSAGLSAVLITEGIKGVLSINKRIHFIRSIKDLPALLESL